MPQPHFIRKFAGLADSANPYDAEGGLSVADNAVIRSKDLIESRRGYSSVTSASPINALGWKEGKLLCLGWDDAGRGITGQLRYYDFTAGTFTSLPMTPGSLPFDRPGGVVGQRTRFISANKATYFQSKYGLTKVEALSAAVCRVALQPPHIIGPDDIAVSGVGTHPWLLDVSQTAYRITVCRYGANHELIESEPSDRYITSNAAGSTQEVTPNVSNTFMMPQDAFFRLYRVLPQVLTANGPPGDEMYLVQEPKQKIIVSGLNGYQDVSSAGPIAQVDQTADTSLSVPLYTNPYSGSGLASAKAAAPLAADMAYFKNRMLFLNTTDVQRIKLQIIGTGTGGITDGATITIATTYRTLTLRFKTAPTLVTDVQLSTAGTVAQNLEATGRALMTAIWVNMKAAYLAGVPLQGVLVPRYISLTAKDAGTVALQSALPGSDAFTITTSSRNGWSFDYTGGVASDANTQQGGIYWSEQDEPEAVPLQNFAVVGDTTSAGQRIIALKEAALIFKQNNNNSNDGLWRWTDDGVNVDLQLADPTVRLIAPETAQPLGNYVFALCDQGVLLFTENGQSVNVSHDEIERELLKLIAYVGRDTMAAYAFAVPYEIEGQYILCLPESPNATSCTKQYVYSTRTETWERWTIPGVIAGTVDPNSGKLVWAMGPTAMAPAGSNNLWVERKAYDSTDYQDPGFSIACPVNTAVATMIFSGDLRTGSQAFAPGDLIQQAQATYFVQGRVRTVTYNSTANQTTVKLDAAPTHPWSNAQNISILKAIQTTLTFLPFHGGQPLVTKEWGDCYLLFRYCDLDWLTAAWSSELYAPDSAIEQISGTTSGSPAALDAFASLAFDSQPWDRPAKHQILKSTLPRNFGECALLGLTLTLGNALCRWELAGIDPRIDQGATDVVR
jgi:hypothetical protein